MATEERRIFNHRFHRLHRLGNGVALGRVTIGQVEALCLGAYRCERDPLTMSLLRNASVRGASYAANRYAPERQPLSQSVLLSFKILFFLR
jgi:hypothetical protein